ncbi:hypothetical protein [Marinifilum fragile]|uniref:hypothetical protein n=1 Tax=Marinifilum fragile TaxID=570161 RepID=UPI002AA7E644|nr:hypothetical protein [Marinifilum fragile]
MRKLVESIQIMTKFAREMGNRNKLLVDFGFPQKKSCSIKGKEMTLLNSLFYMTVIDSVSFLDEYQQVFGVKTEKNYKNRIIVTKSINKPLISKVLDWKDLREFRNNLLAHNMRKGKNGDFVFSISNLDYNAPRNLNDLFLLSNLVQFSTATIHSEFRDEIEAFDSKTMKEIKPNERLLSKEDVSDITVKLLNEANKIKVRNNRTYDFKLEESIDWNKI